MGYANCSAKILPPGTLLFTSRAGIGKTAILAREGCTNQGFQSIVPHKGELDSYFLFSRTIELKRYAEKVAGGSTFSEVSGKQMAAMTLNVPSELIEQQVIGNFFQRIDRLITLHQRKLDKLQNVKKACLEKMFPQNGESVPRIRFKGFTDTWEQCKFGDIGQTYTGLSGKTKEDFGHGNARFVTYMNVFTNPVCNPEMTEPIELDSKQNEVQVGDIFFTTSSETPEEVGMSSVLLEKQGVVYLNSFCFGFRPRQKICSNYYAYMLRSNVVRRKLTLLAQGISRYNISKKKVMEMSISQPSQEEQECIGEFFVKLDELITLHQREHL